MAEDFYAIPIKSTYSPYSSPTVLTPMSSPVLTSVTIGSTANTVLIGPPALSIYPPVRSYPYVTTGYMPSNYLAPTGAYYYDSGIGENGLSQYEITKDQRFRFLDEHLYKDHDDILKMLK